MENFFILIGVAVGALLLGYFFIKHYNSIDCWFFDKNQHVVVDNAPDYKPFGRFQVLASAVCGVAISVLMIATSRFIGFGIGDSGRSFSLAVALVWVVILSYNLYEAIVRMNSFGTRLGKFFFLTVACAVGFGFGVIGSLLVFVAIIFYIIYLAFRIAIKGSLFDPTEEQKKGAGPGGCKYREHGWCTQVHNQGNRCPYHGGFERCKYINF